MIARCALEFAPWQDFGERMRACRSLTDIEAWGPECRPYLEAIATVNGWAGRDLGAPRAFAQLGSCHSDRAIRCLLKFHGVPAWSIWSLRLLGDRDPGPARRILRAYGAVRSALHERDKPVAARFSDCQTARCEWLARAERTPASPPGSLVVAPEDEARMTRSSA